MDRPRQFSLAYLFLEIFWIAAALGLISQAMRIPKAHDVIIEPPKLLLIAAGIVCTGTAIGGLFRRMTIGFLATFVVTMWSIISAVAVSEILDRFLTGR